MDFTGKIVLKVRTRSGTGEAVSRKAIVERMRLLEQMDKQLAGSRLTEEDTITLGRKIKHGISKKFMRS